MAAKIFRINYKSDFILTLNSDAGWMTPFCIKFWTGAPSQAFFAQWDGTTYTHCSYDPSEPTKLVVQFDDHHLPIGDLKLQIAYHFTVGDFPNDTEDEVINPEDVTVEVDGQEYQVMLDFTGETSPEIQFSLPAYANEAQRIANEEQRIAEEQTRIENEQQRITNETNRENMSEADHRVAVTDHEQAESDHTRANNDHTRAESDHTIASNDHTQAGADHTRAESDHTTASNDHTQAGTDHTRAGEDHTRAESDHTQAGNDHTRAESDHTTASNDHTQAGTDHTRAESDHTRAESDHAAIEPFMDSLGAFDISAYHAEGGVLAKYANISAALGPDGTNIPEAIRKGGMSVKFIQSSDNKYTQWRLLKDSFTTNLSYWENIDNNQLDCSMYFQNGRIPRFSLGSDNKYTITFPEGFLRIYKKNGDVIVNDTPTYSESTFDISVLESLVYDFSDSTVKVVSDNTLNSNSQIKLFEYLSIGCIGGLLASFFYNNALEQAKADDRIIRYKASGTGYNNAKEFIPLDGHKYKVTFLNPYWNVEGISSNFYGVSIYSVKNGTETRISYIPISSMGSMYTTYEFISDEWEKVIIRTRSVETVNITIEDTTEVSNVIYQTQCLGTTIAYGELILKKNTQYEVSIVNKDYDRTGISEYTGDIFFIQLNKSPWTKYCAIKNSDTIKECYYFNTGNNTNFTFNVRGTIGEKVFVQIKDITSLKGYAERLELDYIDNIIDLYPPKKYFPKIATLKKMTPYGYSRTNEPLVLLWFSDIHADKVNTERINIWRNNYLSLIDDVINTGDTVDNTIADYDRDMLPYFNNYGGDMMLNTIGNHDVAPEGSTNYMWDDNAGITTKDIYDKYIAPMSASLNIVKPTDAATLGLCYYYKDYTNRGINGSAIRLIVLDTCITNSAYQASEKTWLEGVLASAKTAGYPVVIATHYAPHYINEFDTDKGFSSPENRTSAQYFNDDYINIVDNFIQGGGEFVCWLCGHGHFDRLGTVDNHSDQIVIAITSACMNTFMPEPSMPYRKRNTETNDAFNHIEIDSYNKEIKMVRIGFDYDAYGRPIDMIAINYATRSIIK